MSSPLILASASPARKKLLQMIGIDPIVRVSNFDESTINADDTLHLVQTLAQCKAQTIAPQFDTGLILGCDSVLEVAGEVYGKPKDKSEAINRWQKMRGQVGTLYTGHALIDRVNHQTLTRCGITKVHF
ncbi:MAG: Maf family nucleotide pyrophosphatase, partial [Microcystis panniformis]